MATKKKKIWPWVLGTLVGVGVVGGAAVAFRRVNENIHRYMNEDQYNNADVLPADSMIVVIAYDPGHPLAMNVDTAAAELSASNPDVHYVLVSKEIGIDQLDMDLDGLWGRVDAGHGDQIYTGGFGTDTTADDVKTHLQAATAAVKAGAYGTTTAPPEDADEGEEPETATLDVGE